MFRVPALFSSGFRGPGAGPPRGTEKIRPASGT